MSIGVIGITHILNKKYNLSLLTIIFASLFHPFVLLYLVSFFLREKVWSKLVFIILLTILICLYFLSGFLDLVYNLNIAIGNDLDKSEIYEGTELNIFRLIFYLITPVLTYFTKEKITLDNKQSDILFINLTTIGAGIMFMALFTNALLFSRLANYFDPFLVLSLTIILTKYITERFRFIVKNTVLLAWLGFYFFLVYSKDFIYKSSLNLLFNN